MNQEFKAMHDSMNYVFENEERLVKNGFGFMMRQDYVSSYMLALSLARLRFVLDASALEAVNSVYDNQTIIDNAGTNSRGEAMALISFPAGLDLTTIFTIHAFMIAMRDSSQWYDGANDFYSVLVG